MSDWNILPDDGILDRDARLLLLIGDTLHFCRWIWSIVCERPSVTERNMLLLFVGDVDRTINSRLDRHGKLDIYLIPCSWIVCVSKCW